MSSRKGHIELLGDTRLLVLDRGQRNEVSGKTGDKSLARFDHYCVLVDQQALSAGRTIAPQSHVDGGFDGGSRAEKPG